jgi:hypothetical protein
MPDFRLNAEEQGMPWIQRVRVDFINRQSMLGVLLS